MSLLQNPGAARYPSLDGKRVLITGGASGIGEAMVEGFAAQGAQVGFIDMAEQPGRALVERLTGRVPHLPTFSLCDLTDLDALQSIIQSFVVKSGGLDVLVNNAGNDDRHTIDQVSPAYWDERMAVNLRHFFFASQAAIPSLERRGGAIVNFGSISWRLGLPDLALYQTAKAAIEGLTRSLARDLGTKGIRVNAILPGAVDTPRQKRWTTAEAEQAILNGQCLPGRIMPNDVAAMALFLASDDARMCTGQNYFVDAGWA